MKRFCLWLCRWSQLLCLFSPHANIRHRTRYDRNISYVVSAHIRRLRLVLLSSLVSIIHCVSVAQTIYFKMRKTNELQLLFSFNPFHVEWNKMSHFISQFQDLFFVSFFFVIENWKVIAFWGRQYDDLGWWWCAKHSSLIDWTATAMNLRFTVDNFALVLTITKSATILHNLTTHFLYCICADWIELADSIYWRRRDKLHFILKEESHNRKKKLKCFAIVHNANIRWR